MSSVRRPKDDKGALGERRARTRAPGAGRSQLEGWVFPLNHSGNPVGAGEDFCGVLCFFHQVVDLLRAAQSADTVRADVPPELCLFLILGAGSHLFDVSALAEHSRGVDTTAAWKQEAFIGVFRTLLKEGLFKRKKR